MKNKLILIIIIMGFLFLPLKVEAASISVAGTKASAVVGGSVTVKVTLKESKGLGSWEFSLSYDSDKLQLTSGNAHVVDYVQGAGQTSKTYTYTFRVKGKGQAKISVVNASIAAWDESLSTPSDSTIIECITQQQVADSYSSNNYLKNLTVEGQTLNFDKNTLDYYLAVASSVTTVNINAEKEDGKASIQGIGQFDVHEGANVFDIVVTAENGSRRTYKITVQVEELNPVTIKVAGKEYTVVRKSTELTDLLPKHVEETTIKIGKEEVLAYRNSVLKLTLLALKDKKGNIQFYSYDKGTYQKYQEMTAGNLTVYVVNNQKKIPDGYQKKTIKIAGISYDFYQLPRNDEFYVFYGKNVETGKASLYVYDIMDKSLQRYNDGQQIKLQEKVTLQSYLIIGLLGLVIILLLVFLFALRTKKKTTKKKRERKEQKEFLK